WKERVGDVRGVKTKPKEIEHFHEVAAGDAHHGLRPSRPLFDLPPMPARFRLGIPPNAGLSFDPTRKYYPQAAPIATRPKANYPSSPAAAHTGSRRARRMSPMVE